MKIKHVVLVLLSLMLIGLLVSCTGNQLGSMNRIEAPVAEEPASPAEEDIILTPTANEPTITQELLTQTSEPTSEEQHPTAEPIHTEEIVTADELITETPEIKDHFFPTEELIETEEPSETEEPVETEEPMEAADSLSIEPAEGFWAISSYDGQMVTVVPKDWLHPDEFVFFELNAESFTTPGEQIFLQVYASPDKKAYICYLIYSDEAITNWNQALAQERALRILNELYTKNARDIKVTNVQLMMDGSERLTWSSEACDCTGVIAYKAGPPTEGTVVYQKNLWLFNTLSINSHKNTYIDIFNYAFELLTFPPKESQINP